MGSGIKRTAVGLAAALALVSFASAVPASAGAAAAFWYNGGVKVGAALGVQGESEFALRANLNGTPTIIICKASQEGTVSSNPLAARAS
jgi:hypothetical protein